MSLIPDRPSRRALGGTLLLVSALVFPAMAQQSSKPTPSARSRANLKSAAREEAAAPLARRDPRAAPEPGALPDDPGPAAGGPIVAPQVVNLANVTRKTVAGLKKSRLTYRDVAALAGDAPAATPRSIRVHEPLPQDLPLPENFRLAVEPERAAAAAVAAPVAESPAFGPDFEAIDDNERNIPPDTTGAVGPNHLMVATNSELRVLDRTGVEIGDSRVTLNRFWRDLNTPDVPEVFDPRLYFDAVARRWIFVCVANSFAGSSSLLIAASMTDDPTGDWALYRYDADASDVAWIDYPSVGYNGKWVVVQCNMFGIQGGGSFLRSNIYVFDKSKLYADEATSPTLFEVPGIGGTQCPAVTHDPGEETMFLVQNWNGNTGGQGVLRVYTVTGPVGMESVAALQQQPSATAPWASRSPAGDFAPQMGAPQRINTGDARIQSVVVRGGSLWCAQTVFLFNDAGTAVNRASVQWWEIGRDGSVQQRGRIDDPTAERFACYPSLEVNANRDVLIGFSAFSPNTFADAAYAFRSGNDSPDSVRPLRVFKAGEASYFKTFGGDRNRWGDYSATALDPANPLVFWTIQSYAESKNPTTQASKWGAWWARVVPPGAVGDGQ